MAALPFQYGTDNPAVTLTAVTANGGQDINLPPDVNALGFVVDIGTCTNMAVPNKINIAWTVGGTTPSINANIDPHPFKIGA